MNKYPITENNVRNRVGERSFARGKKYAEQGAIMSPWIQSDLLKGQCWGSAPQPYHLWAQLGPQGIENGSCSCPVGEGGACKHIAALLLTWLNDPDQFQEVEPLEKALSGKSKAELIALISQMAARQPNLEELVYLTVPTKSKGGQAVNSDLIRRQVEQAVRRSDYGHAYYGAVEAIASEAETIMRQAEAYENRGDWLNAAVIYSAVLDELISQHDRIYDHDGDLGMPLGNGSERLGECLTHLQEPEARLKILQTLMNVVSQDIDLGGYGFADNAAQIVMDEATPTEKAEIASWIEEKLAGLSAANEYSRDWQMKAYGGLLLDLQEESLSDDQFLEICRRTNQRQPLVDRLLTLGRLEEAVADAQEASDYELLGLAGLFVTYGRGEVAEGMVWERAGRSKDSRLTGWLKQYAADNGDWPKAIGYAEELLWQRPTLEHYRDVKEIAEKLGDWAQRRPAILQRLTGQQDYETLTRIYLLDNEVRAALGSLAQVKYRSHLELEVAQAAEKAYPHEAIAIYKRTGEQLIGQRNRGKYAQAAVHLQRVKQIYAALGETAVWQSYIGAIRNQQPRLPALLDELKQAGVS